jgi:hypothetical protein
MDGPKSVAGDVRSARAGARLRSRYADVAQLVERNLAKVEVAGSIPVVRSENPLLSRGFFRVEKGRPGEECRSTLPQSIAGRSRT